MKRTDKRPEALKKSREILKEKYKDPEFMEKRREQNRRASAASKASRLLRKIQFEQMQKELQELKRKLT